MLLLLLGLGGWLGTSLACGADARRDDDADAGGGAAAGAGGGGDAGGDAGDAGSGGSRVLATYCSGSYFDDRPSADLQALLACDAPEPCEESLAQLAEGEGYYIDELTPCLLSALAERRVGRYQHRTESVVGGGSGSAFHTLVVHADGAVTYLRDPGQCVPSVEPVAPLPPEGPSRCSLKPASYFEACLGAIEALGGRGAYPPEGTQAWQCAFGDGDGYTPNNLFWFESCEPEAPPRCE